ncbi:hypothetical protein BN2537_2905 [Streptomyces venezuelae]|nr:hypothetical protein BN2537_2905 [Streptomyces venezuelae]
MPQGWGGGFRVACDRRPGRGARGRGGEATRSRWRIALLE